MKKSDYMSWINDAVKFINDTIEKINQHKDIEKLQCINIGSTQYLPKGFNEKIDIDLIFLGHDAHEGKKTNEKFTTKDEIIERFKEGNGKPNEWRDTDWRIWNNFESIYARVLKILGNEELVNVVDGKMILSEKMLEKLVVTNAILFNYIGKAEELNRLLGSVDKNIVNECMQLTTRLIFDVIKPKFVICSSTNLVYAPLIAQYNKYFGKEVDTNIFQLEGRRRVRVGKCEIKYGDGTYTKVIGIPHTSYQSNLTDEVIDFILKENVIGVLKTSSSMIAQNRIRTNKYRQPTNEDVEGIFKNVTNQLISILGKPFELNDKTQRFGLNNEIAITITKSGKGYIGIRHTSFDNKKKYSNEEYPNTRKYTDILNQYGFNVLPKNGCWLGTKFFKNFGYGNESITNNILSEISTIVGLINE